MIFVTEIILFNVIMKLYFYTNYNFWVLQNDQVLAYVSQVHNVRLPEHLVDHESLNIDQVYKLILFKDLYAWSWFLKFWD